METTIPNSTLATINDYKNAKIAADILENLPTILDIFKIGYDENDKYIQTSCPIHQGDNGSALVVFKKAYSIINWKCYTRGCETIFGKHLFGFVRGILSRFNHKWTKDGDTKASTYETQKFIENVLHKRYADIEVSQEDIEKWSFVRNSVSQAQHKIENGYSKNCLQRLQIPSPYFLTRGFSPEILTKYDVGDSLANNKQLGGRAIVPIYDSSYQHIIGYSGRRIKENDIAKWMHSANLNVEHILYNLWFAKEYIQKTKTAVIVESPGNVWRLEEAEIHNAVATFGDKITDMQINILNGLGVLSLYVVLDNDAAGAANKERIKESCKRLFRLRFFTPKLADVAEMSIMDIREEILPKLEKLEKIYA